MNSDEKEIKHFDKVSDIWWDPKGDMGTLHTINPLRTRFIMGDLKLHAQRVLDVGCGGGILSEALAKSGARVIGIDLSQASLEAARRHAREQGLAIEYRFESVEEIVKGTAGSFDIVTCMEMLEHVPDPGNIVAACAMALKPGGHAYFSTINRTLKALLFVIFAGEYILHLLPRGSHTYKKLIRPLELKGWAQEYGLEFVKASSLIYNPFNGTFKAVDGMEDVNYMMHFIKK